jgi:hypothetical protein
MNCINFVLGIILMIVASVLWTCVYVISFVLFIVIYPFYFVASLIYKSS